MVLKVSSVLKNKILAALPESEYERLVPHLEKVSLSLGQVLYEDGEEITHVYFPNSAMISLVSMLEDGATTEIGMIGREGVLGLPCNLGKLSDELSSDRAD